MPDKDDLSTTADAAVKVACDQLQAGLVFRQPRMNRIGLIEDMYAMKEKPALVGMYNVPFDGLVLRGYVDTLQSKIDDTTQITYKNLKEGSLKSAKKVQAAWERESMSGYTNWPLKDRWAKKLAIISGRGTLQVYGESDPKFKFCIENVDHYDFVGEPNGGGHLDSHLFKYRMNIFMTSKELEAGVKAGRYNQKQVQKLMGNNNQGDFKETEDEYKNKTSRFSGLGLNAETNNYVGDKLFNLTVGEMIYQNEKYYILFERKSKIWVRFERFKKVFDSELSMFVSWATDDEPFSYLNLGPCDNIVPVAEAMRINLNGMLNNMRKKIDAMIAYDPEVVTDPSQLIYRPNGFISAILKNRPGLSLQDVVHYLPTEDVATLAVSMSQYLNNFLGENSGITAGAKGLAEEDKVGIYYGNIQQVADRIGRLNKSYTMAVEEVGRRFDWALWEHAPQDYMVKIIGAQGAEWEQITKEDTDPDYEVAAVSSKAEQVASELKAQKQEKALGMMQADPTLAAIVSPKWRAEKIMLFGGFEEEDVRVALDTQNEGNQEILAEAARLIENCLEGKPIKPFRGANRAFYKKIIDFAYDNNLDDKEFFKLIELADSHKQFIEMNETRAAMEAAHNNPAPVDPNAPDQVSTTSPVPPIPNNTLQPPQEPNLVA